jgi:hypothetical protein
MSARPDVTARPDRTVDETVAALAAELPVLSFRRRGLLREVRDGLEDAADAYRRAGLEPEEAECRAVADFGDPALVAADYDSLRAARSGMLAALVLGPGYVAVLAAWLLGKALHPALMQLGPPNPLAQVYDWLGVAAVVTALLGALGLRARARSGGSPRTPTRLIGIAGLVLGVVTLATSYLLSPWDLSPVAPFSLRDGVELFSGLIVVTMLASALRAVVLAGGVGPRLDRAHLVR